MPTISVIIPTYNSAKTLRRAIKSVKDADEIIVVDDASIDKTQDVLKDLSNKYGNLIYVRNEKNIGPYKSRFSGIDIATSDWITFLDADDTVSFHAIQKIKDFLDSEPTTDVLQMQIRWSITSLRLPYSIKNKYQTNQALDACLYDDSIFPIHCCGKVYKTKLLKKTAYIESNVRWGEDRLFNLAIMAKKPRIHIDKSIKYCYTYHKQGLSNGASIENDIKEVSRLKVEWCKENGLEQHVPLIERECSFLLDYVQHKTVK